MKFKQIVVLILLLPTVAFGAAIATMPNNGGGKIVLTNEPCVHDKKTYEGLNRAYNYTAEGHTNEGCFHVEDETVVVIWNTNDGVVKMRYPAENFTLIKRKQNNQGKGLIQI